MGKVEKEYSLLHNRFESFLALFSSEKQLDDRLFYMAFYLCLGFLPPLIGILGSKALPAPLFIISTLIILRFFMRGNTRTLMIRKLLSPPLLLLFMLPALLLFHATISALKKPEIPLAFFKPFTVFLIATSLTFVWSHKHLINKALFMKLAFIGFWTGLALLCLKILITTVITIGSEAHYAPSIIASFFYIETSINRHLLILSTFCFLAFKKKEQTQKTFFVLLGLYIFIFILTFFTIGFQKYNNHLIMVKTASETIQFGIPLVILFLIFFWFKPKNMVSILFILFAFIILNAPWLFQAWYWLLENIPALPKAKKLLIRAEIWDGAARQSFDAPFFGFGIESIRYHIKLDIVHDYISNRNISHPHNIILQVWLDLGILGVTIILGFLFLSWRALKDIAFSKILPILPTFLMTFIVILATHSLWHIWMLTLLANITIYVFYQTNPSE